MGAPAPGNGGLHFPRKATAHRAAQTILHLPQWSRAKPQQVAGVRGLYGLVPPLFVFVISYVKGGFDALCIWMGCDSCYSTSTPVDPCSTSSSHRRSVRSETLAFQVQIPSIFSRSALAGCGRRCATLIIVEFGLQEDTVEYVRHFSTAEILTFWMHIPIDSQFVLFLVSCSRRLVNGHGLCVRQMPKCVVRCMRCVCREHNSLRQSSS